MIATNVYYHITIKVIHYRIVLFLYDNNTVLAWCVLPEMVFAIAAGCSDSGQKVEPA
jgi:hypothetical protein